jgi:carbamoyl-phosphate synthase/aspartate carbamoyltransferase/dihydroorotase
MLTAVAEGRLTLTRLRALMADNPRRIYGLPPQPDTWIEVETGVNQVITNDEQLTRCGWTPFAGTRVTARVVRTVLRGNVAYEDGHVLAPPGTGRLLP